MLRRHAAALVVPLILAACSGDDGGVTPTSTSLAGPATSSATTLPPATTSTTVVEAPPTTTTPLAASTTSTTVAETPACDTADAVTCLLPWPNDAFTTADPASATGRRLAIPTEWAPTNVAGIPIDLTDQNRGDGFSPGSAVILHVPGVDLERSGMAPVTDIGASLAHPSPVTITDTATGDEVALWGELDAQSRDPDRQLLMIHPATAWREGHTYRVEIGELVDARGNPLPTPRPWEFTIASAEGLAGRALAMRAEVYEELADGSPAYRIDAVDDAGDTRIVRGAFDVPSFLDGDGGPGSSLLLDDTGSPERNTERPFLTASFTCVLPLQPAPRPTIVYGHGLLGSRDEVINVGAIVNPAQVNACATDWLGMSRDDIAVVVENLGDLSQFHRQADRMLHGLLAFQLLGRLVNNPQGLVAAEAFAGRLLPDGAAFLGNSQGGILGGAASALSTEWSNVVLGVPGMNYSLLLHRSSDWPEFQTVFDVAYTDPIERVLALQLIQLLWDRGENDAYAQHLTAEPYEGISAKQVLLIEAFGDHQVANVATELLARTIGAGVDRPTLAAGRSTEVEPMWGIPERVDGAVAVLSVWDFGTPAPPTVNRPPSEPEYGRDPHGAGSSEIDVITRAIAWLLAGTYAPCGGPCSSDALSG